LKRTPLLVAVWAAVALGASAAALFQGRAAGPRGLTLGVRDPGSPATLFPPSRVGSVDVRDLNADPRLRAPVAARWDGFWHVGRAGDHRLVAESDGPVTVRVDGTEILRGGPGRVRADVSLSAGPHALAVEYTSAAPPRQLRLHWVAPDGARREFAGDAVFTRPRSTAEERAAARARALDWAAAACWILPPAALLVLALGRRVRRGRSPAEWLPAGIAGSPRMRLALAAALPAVVVAYGGALRIEALMARYGWAGPAWAVDVERVLSRLHPDALRWQPSPPADGGDPYHYLRRAREMEGFYDANVREPLFPFATRLLLGPLDDTPWTVNAASAVFSTLLVLATYVLGAVAFRPAVGLGAALVMAADRDALWWGVEGFRDDAFTLFVLLSAAALWRVREQPGPPRALLAGLAGGAACLTRITAFSFLVPAHVWLALGRGASASARRKAAALSLASALAVTAPYLASCALAYGDPFHAVNAHTRFYRSRAGLAHEADMSWHAYLRTGFAPAELARTGLAGLTTHPFASKWQGLDYVTPWLRRLLAPLAVAGLLLWVASRAGRLMLVVLFGALVPYAFTWNVPGGAEWRFTLVAYPFYALAAFSAVDWLFRRLRRNPRPAHAGASIPGAPAAAAAAARPARGRPGARS
jgi:hypothetical protein